jgi:hypothetical protein
VTRAGKRVGTEGAAFMAALSLPSVGRAAMISCVDE